jgi:hypothetical protein
VLIPAILLTMLIGDELGVVEGKYQPMKIAAAEAQWTTCQPCSFSLFQIGGGNNDQTPTEIIAIPHLLSLLATNHWNGQVVGMTPLNKQYNKQYGRGDYVPNVFIQYWGMRVMALPGHGPESQKRAQNPLLTRPAPSGMAWPSPSGPPPGHRAALRAMGSRLGRQLADCRTAGLDRSPHGWLVHVWSASSPADYQSAAAAGPVGRACSRLANRGMKRPRPIVRKTRKTGLPAGMTSRRPPPSASAHLCTATSTLNPSESQNRVPVMSSTTVACPRVPASRRTVRSCSALTMSISAGAFPKGTPLVIRGYLRSGTCDAHLLRGRVSCPGVRWAMRTWSRPFENLGSAGSTTVRRL